MEVGLVGAHMGVVVLLAEQDKNTELDHAHHPNHRMVALIVVEAHP